MPGIPPSVMCHKLDIKPGYKPVKQKLRHQGKERIEAAKEEVEKLLKAGFFRECKYSDWLSNVVLVKKSNGKWRMCVEFTDLKQDMSEIRLSSSQDRSLSGFHGRPRLIELHRC